MLNPEEMNFYGTRNDGSLAYNEEVSEPNKTTVEPNITTVDPNLTTVEPNETTVDPNKITVDPNQQSQSNVSEPATVDTSQICVKYQGANDDGDARRNRTGKWVDPGRGKRSRTYPYPSPSFRSYPPTEKRLPKSLQELFTPYKCNLCKCTMGSFSTTRDHYSGKKHNLNVRKWFLIHPEYQEGYTDCFGSQRRIMDPNKLYCKYCDVMLSSEQQVESHYLGKKHQSTINSGIPKNAFFNAAKGQWERFPKGATEGRFGIGFGFLEKQIVGKDLSPVQKCFCEMCMVACPSEITFQEHLRGSKHRKKVALLKSLEISSAFRRRDVEEGSNTDANAAGTSDLSIYKTPTGKYYCSTCNVTVNSPTQFVQHSESKKHKSRAVLPVDQPPTKE